MGQAKVYFIKDITPENIVKILPFTNIHIV